MTAASRFMWSTSAAGPSGVPDSSSSTSSSTREASTRTWVGRAVVDPAQAVAEPIGPVQLHAQPLAECVHRHKQGPGLGRLPVLIDPHHFFYNDSAPTELYTRWDNLTRHDALPI